MAEKKVKSRIQIKRDNTDNWNTAGEAGFTPKEGEIIFYSDVNKLKVGDGKTAVHLLPFIQVDADEIGEHEHSNYYTEDEVDALLAAKADASSIGTGSTEATVKLAEDLYTYTNIGKITGASNTNPKLIASAGSTLKSVFNKVFGEQVDTEPSPSNNASLDVAAGTTSYGGGEYGTTVNATDVNITFTLYNSGTATYGYRCGDNKTTGNQTFYYPVTKQSNADIVITLPVDKTATVVSGYGTLVSSSKGTGSSTNNILYCNFNSDKKVRIKISLPKGSVTTSSQTRFGQISASVTLGAAQKENQLTSGTAITSFLTFLGKDAANNSKLSGGTKSGTAGSYTISAGSYYNYYLTSTSTSLSNPVTTATMYSGSSVSISCSDASHIWFLLPPGTSGSKSIQYEPFANTWVDAFGGATDTTVGPVDVSLKLDSGETATYKGYYTSAKAAAGSNLNYKIV